MWENRSHWPYPLADLLVHWELGFVRPPPYGISFLNFMEFQEKMAKWFTVLCFGIRGCGFKPPTNACRYIICKYVDQKEVSVAPKKDLWKIGKIYGWRPPWDILDPPLLTFDCEGQPRTSIVTFARCEQSLTRVSQKRKRWSDVR